MPEFYFEVKLIAGVFIEADDEEEARDLLDQAISTASVEFADEEGVSGDVSVCEDGQAVLIEVDGEPAPQPS